MYLVHVTLFSVLCVMIELCAHHNSALSEWLEGGCVLIAGRETQLTSNCTHKATELNTSLDECKELLPQFNGNAINYSPLVHSGECNIKSCADEEEARSTLIPYGFALFDAYFCHSEYYFS